VHAELSSMSTTVTTLCARVGHLADGLDADRDAQLLSQLVEIERSMRTISRQLERAARLARP
jgi:hypothetical protein